MPANNKKTKSIKQKRPIFIHRHFHPSKRDATLDKTIFFLLSTHTHDSALKIGYLILFP